MTARAIPGVDLTQPVSVFKAEVGVGQQLPLENHGTGPHRRPDGLISFSEGKGGSRGIDLDFS